MDPQHPPLPFSATLAAHGQRPHNPPPADDSNNDYTSSNEKDDRQQRQSYRTERGSKSSSNGRGHDSVISHPFSPKQSSSPSPSSSISSFDGRRHSSMPECRDSALAKDYNDIKRPPQAYLDPEKHGYEARHDCQSHRHSGSVPGAHHVVYDKSEYQEKAPEDKAWQLLFYLAGPCALLSVVIALWAVVAILVSLALAPLKLCTTSRPSLATQLAAFLVPALNLQLHLVYSHNASQDYSAPMLVVIHLFSPVVALGVAIASWTAAAFWFFSSILGDPGGQDGHNDGKESMLGVRNWWERWLSRALR